MKTTSFSSLAFVILYTTGSSVASVSTEQNGFVLNVQFAIAPQLAGPLNANGGTFWRGKPTQSFCPQTVPGCVVSNTTAFSLGNESSALALRTATPGGQQVYIAPNGLLRYTVPHSGYIPPGSVTTGFSVNATTGQLNKFLPTWLCNTDNDSNAYQVWVESMDEQGVVFYGSTGKNACVRIILMARRYEGSTAWEYSG